LLVDNHLRDLLAPGASTVPGQQVYRGYRAAFGSYVRRRVGTWVAVGPDEGAFLTERLGVEESDVVLIPLGFDPEVFRFDGDRRAALRDRFGWTNDCVVVMTGKITAQKRPEVVSAACERRGAESTRLVIVGQVDESVNAAVRTAAPNLVRMGKLQVFPMMEPEDLADAYLAADVAVFGRPSISVFEAVGTGLPVYLTADRYADWVHARLPAVQPCDLSELDLELVPTGDRADVARTAAAIVGWPTLSRCFLQLYDREVSG
jgi:glycosyltransferase involved in cell wall biosynthesis